MVSLSWPLVFWVGWFFCLLVLCTGAFLCFSLSPCGSSLYTPYILLGALLSFAQYTAFINQKKKKKFLGPIFIPTIISIDV